MRKLELYREKLENLMGYVDSVNSKVIAVMEHLKIKRLQWGAPD